MSSYSISSPTHTSISSYDHEKHSVRFLHTIPQPGRILPSASKWNSIELDFNLAPKSSINYDSIPSPYSKSYDYELVITDRKHLNRFLTICATIASTIVGILLLVHFLPHKHHYREPSKNLSLALNQALTFFDAQKSGVYPKNSRVNFRGDSGLQDGNSSAIRVDLVGGFYDSGNNIKFTFPTAYTITLLSWSVIEYHRKYSDIGELDHVRDIIRWGSDYLLKVFVPPNSKSGAILYSQVGSTSADVDSDVKCWQRPEDMTYERPVSVCDGKAADLAGEIIAALSAASIVFKEDNAYSVQLVKTAKKLYSVAHSEDQEHNKESTYTNLASCGRKARNYYNSSRYKDELVWGATWLFLATRNTSYLRYATTNFAEAVNEETKSDKSIFYWNNKLNAIAVLLTRLRFFHDLGYPYEDALGLSSDITDNLMCFYKSINKTPGGLIFLNPGHGGPLQFAATASFLSKLYADYLLLLGKSDGKCKNVDFSVEMLEKFSASQINYILGDNPMKISFMVGYGDKFPSQVHHRGASIQWDSQHYPCSGYEWLHSKNPNPNILVGAMVAGPDQFDKFFDERDKPWFTEPSIASNAGLVAALIAIHDPPLRSLNLGIDKNGIFQNIP